MSLTAVRQFNKAVARQNDTGYVLLLQLKLADAEWDSACSISAFNTDTDSITSKIVITLDTSVNPSMTNEGTIYNTQVLAKFNFEEITFTNGFFNYELKFSNDAGKNFYSITLADSVPLAMFTVADNILLDSDYGIKENTGENAVIQGKWYQVRYYNTDTPDSTTGLTPVCTFQVLGGTPEHTVTVYETETGLLANHDSKIYQGVSALVSGPSETLITVYYDTSLNPQYGRNSDTATYAYVSVMDTLGHSMQVQIKIMAYYEPTFTEFVYANTFTYAYDGETPTHSSSQIDGPLAPSYQFLIGTFETTYALDTSSSSEDILNDDTVLNITDTDTVNNPSSIYLIAKTPITDHQNRYSLYYVTNNSSSNNYPEFPARLFRPKIELQEYNRTFSHISINAYIHKQLKLVNGVYGRGGLTGTSLTLVNVGKNNAEDWKYTTFYYPQKDSFVENKILVAIFEVSGGLLDLTSEHTSSADFSHEIYNDRTIDFVIAKNDTDGDTSTVSVYANVGSTLEANRTSGRGSEYADFKLTIRGSFQSNTAPNDFEHIDIPIRVYSYSNPDLNFVFDKTFTRSYNDIQAQGLAAGGTIAIYFIGRINLTDLSSLHGTIITSSTTLYIDGTDVYENENKYPSYVPREKSIVARENGLDFTTTIKYYLFPQLEVQASVDKDYINAGDINNHKLTVTTTYGLGEYTLDLSAANTSISEPPVANGFTWDFLDTASASFSGSSLNISVDADDDATTPTITRIYGILLA